MHCIKICGAKIAILIGIIIRYIIFEHGKY